MSTIESQIQKLNDTNAELARVNNELTSAVRTHTNDINNEVAAAKNTMAAATASAISEVKADANAVNTEIKARMDDAVVPWLPAMTKVQFDALRADRKQKYAGSGFVEWGEGRIISGGALNAEPVNIGLWTRASSSDYANQLMFGLDPTSTVTSVTGLSRTPYPTSNIDGVQHTILQNTARSGSREGYTIDFPPVPDGTKTYDSATGSVTKHSNTEVAFASETATNKVITSRKDLVFLESWYEKIADKDIVYPLGNVQYGASSYEGIALSNNLVAQSYSAFGEWDENTQGFGAKWSSLTDAQKALFLSDPEHNIYYDAEAKIYVQVRYRMRVVEGVSDDWNELRPSVHEITTEWAIANRRRITFVQGSDLSISSTVFVMKGHTQTTLTKADMGIAEGEARTFGRASFGSTKPLAVPIALVQRLNQGAYHPVYNPMGCRSWNQQDNGGAAKWHSPEAGNVTNIIQAFDIKHGISNRVGAHLATGSIEAGQSGRSDQYKFYDAIYAGQVEDLRLNANKLDVNKLREDSIRKAVAGTLRGKEKVPFTKVSNTSLDLRIGSDNIEWRTDTDPFLGKTLGYNRLFCSSLSDLIEPKFFTKISPKRYSTRAGIGIRGNDGTWYPVYGIEEFSGSYILYISSGVNVTNNFTTEGSFKVITCFTKFTAEFNSLPWVDIIGDPERIAATFPDGVVGQWVPQVPDGASKNYQGNRKFIQEGTRTITDNDGSSWTFFSNWDGQTGGDLITNTLADGPVPAARVVLNFYESLSNFTEPSNNAQIVGTPGNVYQGNFHHIDRGNRLNSSVSGVIAKQGSAHKGVGFLNINGFTYESWSIAPHKLTAAAQPEHQRVDLASGNESGGMKALSTITEKNGLYYLQLHGAELKHHTPSFNDVNPNANTSYIEGDFYCLTNYGAKGYYVCEVTKTFVLYTNTDYIQMESGDVVYGPTNQVVLRKLNTADGSGWGDDQTIPIVNGEDVKTDLNGNTVKVFCHHSQIPLGIAHND